MDNNKLTALLVAYRDAAIRYGVSCGKGEGEPVLAAAARAVREASVALYAFTPGPLDEPWYREQDFWRERAQQHGEVL